MGKLVGEKRKRPAENNEFWISVKSVFIDFISLKRLLTSKYELKTTKLKCF